MLNWTEIKSLKERGAALKTEASALLAKAKTEKRGLSTDEDTRFTAIETECKAITAQLQNETRYEGLGDFGGIDNSQFGRDRQPGAGDEKNAADKDFDFKNLRIPDSARYVPTIKSYSGECAHEMAYASAQWLRAALMGHRGAQHWCLDHGLKFTNAGGESSGSVGGYLVPTFVTASILRLVNQHGVLRNNADVVPMGSLTVNHPKRLASGGITAYWVDEGNAPTESQMAFGNIPLVAKKLGVLTKYSTELDEDSVVSVFDALVQDIGLGMAFAEDNAGFNGDGSSTYGSQTGIIEGVAAGSIVTAASTHTGFGTLTMADFESVLATHPFYQGSSPKWFISSAGYAASMLRLLDAAGGNTNVTLANGAPQLSFLGYPVVWVQGGIMNRTLGADASQIKAIFGDMKQGVVLGTRRELTTKQSEHFAFSTDQMTVLSTERVSIVVADEGGDTSSGALTLLQSAAS